ncbi:MAG: hypothetical protein WC188_04655 [Candidatus Caldatribacteriota bacterium]
MDLSTSHMFVSNSQFLGVIKSSIIKDFHDIKLKLEFFKILSGERPLIEMVEKDCRENHTNVNSLKLVSTDNIYSKDFNYIDSENFVKYLSFINSRNIQEDNRNKQLWIIDFKFNSDVNFFKIVLNSMQVFRLYSQMNSFYSNYLVLSSIMRQNLVSETPVKQEKKVTEYIPETPQEESKPVIVTKERNELDNIFELCLNGSIKSSLIHYTFNYYRYLTDSKYCSVLNNDKGQVQYTLPILLPGKFNIDESYFRSLILSNSSISLNNISFIIKKILTNLNTEFNYYKSNPLILLMINYLLFIYLLRYLYDTNKDSFTYYFNQFICLPTVQNQLITKLVQSAFSNFHNKIFFKIVDVDEFNILNNSNDENIKKISEDYKHLIPVSQQDFADKIFNKLSEIDNIQTPLNFKLSNKKFIDISKYITTDNKKQSNSILFDPDNTLDENTSLNEYNFLNYQVYTTNNNGNSINKVVTKTYQALLNYIKNPASLLLLENTNSEIPKEVLNLFEVISKKVLNSAKITKDTISTLKYYNILLESLPNPQEFKHITFLYIIFQIILPYHNDIYNNLQFEDYLL